MKRSPLVIILMTVFIALIGFGIVIPLLPIYAERFGANGFVVGLMLMVYSLMQFIVAPIAGKLSDRIGRRPVIIGSLTLTALSYLMFGFAHNLTVLFISRILAGIGGGDITVAQAYIADVTPPERRARGMGLFGAAFGVGFIVGPVITAIFSPIAEVLPAFIAAGLAGVTVIFALINLPEPEKHVRKYEDDGTKYKPSRPVKVLTGLYFFNTLVQALTQSMLVLFTFHLFGWGTSKNGMFIAGYAVIGAIIQGGFMGKLANRFGERNLLRFGLIVTGLGLLLLGNAGPLHPVPAKAGGVAPVGWLHMPTLADSMSLHGSLIVMILGTLIFAAGFALTLPSLSSLISRKAPPNAQGQAMGTFQSMGSLARIVGPLVGGVLFDHVGIAAPFLFGGWVGLFAGIASLKLLGGRGWQQPGVITEEELAMATASEPNDN